MPTNVKWQIGLFLWYKPYRGGAGTAGGAKRPPWGIPKGTALGAPLVTFPRDGKVTRVQGGAPASRGCGGAAPTLGSAEGQHPSQKTNPGYFALGEWKESISQISPWLLQCHGGGSLLNPLPIKPLLIIVDLKHQAVIRLLLHLVVLHLVIRLGAPGAEMVVFPVPLGDVRPAANLGAEQLLLARFG